MHQFYFLVSSHEWHILYQWNGRMHYAVLFELEHTIIGFSAWINYNECAVRMHWSTRKLRKWHFSVKHFMYCGLRKEHLAGKKKLYLQMWWVFVLIWFTHMSKSSRKIVILHCHICTLKSIIRMSSIWYTTMEAKRIGIVFNFYFYFNYLFRDIFKWRCWQNVAKKQWDI